MRTHEGKQTDLQTGRGLASVAQLTRLCNGWTQSSGQANASELAENTTLLYWLRYGLDYISHEKGPTAALGLCMICFPTIN